MDYAKRDGVWIKVRTRVGENPALLPKIEPLPFQPQQNCPSPGYFNFDFHQPHPFIAALTEPHPFMSDPHQHTAPEPSQFNENPTPQRPTIERCEEQIQRIIHELSLAQSSKSSGDSGSSVNDYTLIPHISTVFETLSQVVLSQNQIVHDMQVLNGRVFHHNETMMDRILGEINMLKAKLECFETKAEWVTFQMRANETQTRDASNAVDHWSSSIARLSQLLELHLASFVQSAPPVVDPDLSRSHPHLWMPQTQPHQNKPEASHRQEGSSSQPSVISSDDDK